MTPRNHTGGGELEDNDIGLRAMLQVESMKFRVHTDFVLGATLQVKLE